MTRHKNYLERAQIRKRERDKYNSEYFRDHYWVEDLPGSTGNRGLSYDDPSHSKRFNFLFKQLVDFFEFNTVLDAGCGPGLMLHEISKVADYTVGFDISPAAALLFKNTITKQTRHHPLFLVASIHNIPFADDSFDLVWCSDVLEHIPCFDVEEAAFELGRVTRKHLVLTINLDNPYYYHPTILPRTAWDHIFLRNSALKNSFRTQYLLQNRINATYPEYELFIFRKA